MKHYNVVCAVIVNDGCVLCMQRPWRGSESTAGKWELPGEKIEEYENALGLGGVFGLIVAAMFV